MTPYSLRHGCAAVRAVQLPEHQAFHLAGYCLDATEFVPAGSHEVIDPTRLPYRQRAASTLAVRDL